MIIAGDIGGTKTNVALFEPSGGEVGRPLAQQSFRSAHYGSLEDILREFVAAHRPVPITSACFGVAGPVLRGRIDATNLAWKVHDVKLAEAVGVPAAHLINDLEATAYGLGELKAEQLYTLNEGDGDHTGHRALIAAGTGLGMAAIYFDGRNYHPMPSEGGHMDFAPRSEREFELLRYLEEKVGGRVSYERVLSGMGLHNIYSFLRDRGYGDEPAWLAEEIESGDASAAISRAALDGKSELAATALEILVEVYGAMAGNLALLLKSTGGLFVGGLVESIRVSVILDDKTALYGAARYALLQSGR
jgi:glucokinase